MKESLAVLSGLIMLIFTISYAINILKGRAQPARSSRYMYFFLLLLAFLQQNSLGSTWSLVLIGTELFQSAVILILSFRYGRGGFSRLDIVCYLLLGTNILIWISTNSALIAIHVLIIADIVATLPTIIKTKRDPLSETPLYWLSGSIAALFAIASEYPWSYSTLVFLIYLFAINAYVAILALPIRSTNKNLAAQA